MGPDLVSGPPKRQQIIWDHEDNIVTYRWTGVDILPVTLTHGTSCIRVLLESLPAVHVALKHSTLGVRLTLAHVTTLQVLLHAAISI